MGVFIKSVEVLEVLDKVDIFVVDKIGMLIEGKLKVMFFFLLVDLDEKDVFGLVVSLEYFLEYFLVSVLL